MKLLASKSGIRRICRGLQRDISCLCLSRGHLQKAVSRVGAYQGAFFVGDFDRVCYSSQLFFVFFLIIIALLFATMTKRFIFSSDSTVARLEDNHSHINKKIGFWCHVEQSLAVKVSHSEGMRQEGKEGKTRRE